MQHSSLTKNKKLLMKLSVPKSKDHLSIKNSDHVIEVGCGDHPHKRANIVVDKFPDDNTHRKGDLKKWKHQQFIEADGQDLPFETKAFDYAICTQVLEHVADPILFLKEQSRIAKRGYMETPSITGEYLVPKASHQWVLLDIDDKIVMYDKELIGFKSPMDLGDIFLEYLPKFSIGYKILQRTYPQLMTMNYEWKDEIDVLVNPDNEYYRSYFTQPWTKETCEKLWGKRQLPGEAKHSIIAMIEIIKSVFQSKIIRR